MKEYPLSYCPFDCSLNQNKVTFPDAEVATKMSCEWTKRFDNRCVHRPLQCRAHFVSTSIDASNHGNKSALALRYFDLK